MRPDPEMAEHYRQQFEQHPPDPYETAFILMGIVGEAAKAHDATCAGCETCRHLRHGVSLIAAIRASFTSSEALVRLQQPRTQNDQEPE
jgi:hypothetical protein